MSYCTYCNRYFKFNDLYEQHTIACEFFYRSKRVKDREIETYEQLPTQQELYKLIQQLTLQCHKLQKDVERLKSNSSNRTKKTVMDVLNSTSNQIPECSFESWVLVKRPIKRDYLDLVYNEDLTSGIKMYISELIQSEKLNIPIRTFAEKSNNIYIYSVGQSPDNPPSWQIISIEQFGKWTNRIAHRFLQEFSIMQYENMEKINSNETEKDKNIIFMVKINGGKTSAEKRCLDIKKWFNGNSFLRI